MKDMIFDQVFDKSIPLALLEIFLGSVVIFLLAQIQVPIRPVPITLHTFAIFLLALFQGSQKSFYSTALYLGWATLGLPVFPSFVSDPLWMIGPSAGFIAAFPFAAYVIGKVYEAKENPSVIWTALSVFSGQVVIYTLGIGWLASLIGFEQAIMFGLVPFVPMAALKLSATVCIVKAGRTVIG